MGRLLGQVLTVLVFVTGSAAAIGGFATQQPQYIAMGIPIIAFSAKMGSEFFNGVF